MAGYSMNKQGCKSRVRNTPTITRIGALLDLSPERASLGKASLPPSRLAQHRVAVPADHDGLSVAKDSRDIEASRAFHIHEIAIGRSNEALHLVLALLIHGVGVE